MKKILLLIAFITAFGSIYSQEDETLLGNLDDMKFGFYGAFDMKPTYLYNSAGLMLGGRGGVIFNGVFSIGAGGWGLVTSHEVKGLKSEVYDNGTLDLSCGGFIFEYINSPKKLIHFTAGLFIGWGNASVRVNNNILDDSFDYESSSFFALEPNINAELNVTKFFRLELGAGYRFGLGLNSDDISDRDISNFNLNLSFKFGFFNELVIPQKVKEIFD